MDAEKEDQFEIQILKDGIRDLLWRQHQKWYEGWNVTPNPQISWNKSFL